MITEHSVAVLSQIVCTRTRALLAWLNARRPCSPANLPSSHGAPLAAQHLSGRWLEGAGGGRPLLLLRPLLDRLKRGEGHPGSALRSVAVCAWRCAVRDQSGFMHP